MVPVEENFYQELSQAGHRSNVSSRRSHAFVVECHLRSSIGNVVYIFTKRGHHVYALGIWWSLWLGPSKSWHETVAFLMFKLWRRFWYFDIKIRFWCSDLLRNNLVIFARLPCVSLKSTSLVGRIFHSTAVDTSISRLILVMVLILILLFPLFTGFFVYLIDRSWRPTHHRFISGGEFFAARQIYCCV